MFGATEYSVAVDVWSVGTILMELLLGHLPFQGQDSTQQHLVEIMKLLGTPSDRDLQAMRATCCAADLPKLKPFPWERIFSPTTPHDATDLAQRLLRYDPDQRLSAAQALAHPFFDGAQQLVESKTSAESGSSATSHSAHSPATFEQWEEGLKRRIKKLVEDDEIVMKMGQAVVQRLETQFKDKPLNKETVEQVLKMVHQEVNSSLKALDERAQILMKAITEEARVLQLELPLPAGSGASDGARKAQAEEEKRLEAELAEVREAKLKVDKAAAEQTELLAKIKAAQARPIPRNT